MSFEREQIGDCMLYCGDAQEVLSALGQGDALITDPPFGVNLGIHAAASTSGGDHTHLGKAGYATYVDTYENFCTIVVPVLRQSLGQVKRGAVFTGPHIQEQPKAVALGGILRPGGVGRHAWGFKTLFPILFYGYAPTLHEGSYPTTLVSTAQAECTGHPCSKPLAWMLWLVRLASRPGETVLDPFMGSGTTGVACAQLGRSFTGIDIEPRYFDMACQRVEAGFAQPDLFVRQPATRVEQEVLFA